MAQCYGATTAREWFLSGFEKLISGHGGTQMDTDNCFVFNLCESVWICGLPFFSDLPA